MDDRLSAPSLDLVHSESVVLYCVQQERHDAPVVHTARVLLVAQGWFLQSVDVAVEPQGGVGLDDGPVGQVVAQVVE